MRLFRDTEEVEDERVEWDGLDGYKHNAWAGSAGVDTNTMLGLAPPAWTQL